MKRLYGYGDVNSLLNSIKSRRKAVENYIKRDLDNICKDGEFVLRNPVKVNTWNKGYDFYVDKLYNRSSDGSTMIGGTYHGHQDESEFLSYVDYDGLVDIYQEVANMLK